MIKYIPVYCIIFFLSSCIKVENRNLCDNPPPAPVLTSSDYQVAPGATLHAGVIAPSSSTTYYWTNPAGLHFTGSSISYAGIDYYMYGLWSVYAQKGTQCQSDTITFLVSQTVGGCGIGRDSLSMAGIAYPMVYQSTTTAYGTYQMNFAGGYTTATVSFPTKPTTSGTYTVVSSQNYLYSNECSIGFTSGDYYSSNSGTLVVQVSGSNVTMSFCDVQFSYINGYTVGNGYLDGQ